MSLTDLNLLLDLVYSKPNLTKTDLYEFMLTHNVSYDKVKQLYQKIPSLKPIAFKNKDLTAFVRYAIKYSPTDTVFTGELFDLLPQDMYHHYLTNTTAFLSKDSVKYFISKGIETSPEPKIWISLYYMSGFSQQELDSLNQKAQKYNKELAFRVFSNEESLFTCLVDIDLDIFGNNEVFFEYLPEQSTFKSQYYHATIIAIPISSSNTNLYFNSFAYNVYDKQYLVDLGYLRPNLNYTHNVFNLALHYHPELIRPLLFNSNNRYQRLGKSLSLYDVIQKLLPIKLRTLMEQKASNINREKVSFIHIYSQVADLQKGFSKEKLERIKEYANIKPKGDYISSLHVSIFNELMTNWDNYKPDTLAKIEP